MRANYPAGLKPPLIRGYNITDGDRVRRDDFKLGYFDVDILSEHKGAEVSCSWLLKPIQFQVFEGFYNFELDQGARSFLMPLRSAASDVPVNHECYFDGAYSASKQGKLWSVKAKLIVVEKPYDALDDYNDAKDAIAPPAEFVGLYTGGTIGLGNAPLGAEVIDNVTTRLNLNTPKNDGRGFGYTEVTVPSGELRYVEFQPINFSTAGANFWWLGVQETNDETPVTDIGATPNSLGFSRNGNRYQDGSFQGGQGFVYSTNDIIGLAIDLSVSGTCTVDSYLNNVLQQSTSFSVPVGYSARPAVCLGVRNDPGSIDLNSECKIYTHESNQSYSPPLGFLRLE